MFELFPRNHQWFEGLKFYCTLFKYKDQHGEDVRDGNYIIQ